MPNPIPELQATLARCQEAAKAFEGYHQFGTEGECGFGSFEVFHHDHEDETHSDKEVGWSMETGWYWWPCFPGGDPTGPFPTAEGAYLDAIGE